jgi:hypothetical protein
MHSPSWTDVGATAQGALNMFSRVHRRTDLSTFALGDYRLGQAVRWFDETFAPDRSAVRLLFFSAADALTSVFLEPETSYAAAMESSLAQIGFLGELMRMPEPAVLPRQLVDWLGLTYEQLSVITGISRASFFNWRQPGTKPRLENAQKIQQLFAVTSLLVKRLGVRGARSWLHSSRTQGWELLISGDIEGLEHLVRASMFTSQAITPAPNKIPLNEVKPVLSPAPDDEAHTPRRAERSPTRRRLRTE